VISRVALQSINANTPSDTRRAAETETNVTHPGLKKLMKTQQLVDTSDFAGW
jgi:hypothetical protein